MAMLTGCGTFEGGSGGFESARASAGRQWAAMPFVHLEREIWDLRDGSGADAPERGPWLTGRGAVGRLRPRVEQMLADPGTLAAAARRLLYYLYGPGKANEHTDPHLVAGFSNPAELEPERRPNGSRDFRRLAGLLA